MNDPDIHPVSIIFVIAIVVIAGVGFGLYEKNHPSPKPTCAVEQPK